MRHLLILLLIVLCACKSGDKIDHKLLYYTFEDEVGGDAIASTKIEPETNKIVATHISEVADMAVDPATGNLYVATGSVSEIALFTRGDLSSQKTLYTAPNIIKNIAIDPANNKIYWIVVNSALSTAPNLTVRAQPGRRCSEALQSHHIAKA